jgi:hypothetical protein
MTLTIKEHVIKAQYAANREMLERIFLASMVWNPKLHS